MRKSRTAREDATGLADACRDLARRRREKSRGSPDAEDIEQEALLRALSTPDAAAIRDPIRFLFRIARNLFIDRHRHQRREHAALTLAQASVFGGAEPLNPERILLGKDDLQRATEAIEALPPRCQQAFVLHRFHNLSYTAIARRMGVSTSTVEKHIAEAMLRVTRAVHAPEETDD